MADDQLTPPSDCAGPGPKPECDEALHELYDLLSGELDDAKRTQIQAHLDECGPCAEPYDFYAELRRTLQQRCRDTAPPELLARIEAAIRGDAP